MEIDDYVRWFSIIVAFVSECAILGTSIYAHLKVRKARLWKEAQGTITKATIESKEKRNPGLGGETVVKHYPVGNEVKVLYNPKNPGESVLQPRVPALWLAFIFAGGLFVLAAHLYLRNR